MAVAVTQLTAKRHSQCAWCQRLKHRDGTPHGKVFPSRTLAEIGYSHGLCLECKPKLLLAVLEK